MKRHLFRPNKKISVFWVTGLKILSRVGTPDFFFILFFLLQKYLSKYKYVSPVNLGRVGLPRSLKHRYFFNWPIKRDFFLP